MELSLISCGIQSPTGTDAAMSVAGVMGGISRISRSKNIEDRNFEPVSLGAAEYLHDELPNRDRFTELAIPAFEESLAPLKSIKPNCGKIPVFIGLPQNRPGLSNDLAGWVTNRLKSVDPEIAIQFEFTVIRDDHDSGMLALKQIEERMRNQKNEFFIIGGIDSFIDHETIAWLEKERVLKCSHNNLGYIPGEAAAFCLLCSTKTAETYNLSSSATIIGFGSALETQLPGSKIPTTGAAFTKAMQDALACLPEGEKVSELICTLKGLRHEADEFAYSLPAIGLHFENPGEYRSLAPSWGDIGAASAPALMGFAMEKRKLGFGQANYSMVFTMSPHGLRSAALIKVA